jgi:ribonuclease III
MSVSMSRETIESIVGCRVNNPGLYERAFCHKSVANGLITESYERMEFMGDAVINLIVTRYLIEKYRDKDEGFLTRIRTKIVSGKCLSKLASRLGLDRHVQMNDKAMANGWNKNDRILEDVFEAFVGCIYTDLGLVTARDFLLNVIERHVDFQEIERDDNYKDILMRYTQARAVPLPFYGSSETTLEGKKLFEVRCFVNNVPCGYGRHKNKRQAEQAAAHQALLYFDVEL